MSDSKTKTPSNTHIVVRLSPELHAQLKAAAAADQRPISAMARLLIARALGETPQKT
jgi:hypothetical protein